MIGGKHNTGARAICNALLPARDQQVHWKKIAGNISQKHFSTEHAQMPLCYKQHEQRLFNLSVDQKAMTK